MNKHKEIPIGDYCYKITRVSPDYKIKTKYCPYFKLITTENDEVIEYCEFLQKELEVQDSVKDCDINTGEEE